MAGKMIRLQGLCRLPFAWKPRKPVATVKPRPLAEEHDPEELDDLEDVAAATSQRRDRKTSKKAAPTSKKKGRPLWPRSPSVAVLRSCSSRRSAAAAWAAFITSTISSIPTSTRPAMTACGTALTEDRVNAILGPPKKSTNQIWTGIGPKIIVAEWTKKDNTIAVEYNGGQAVKITGKFVTNGETRTNGRPRWRRIDGVAACHDARWAGPAKE